MKFRDLLESKIKTTDLEVGFEAKNVGDADIMKNKKTNKYYYWNPLSSEYVEIKNIKDIEKDTKRYTKRYNK